MSTKVVTTKDKPMSITKTYDLAKPAEAVQLAIILKDIVIKQNLFVSIKGKNYAMVEGWMLAGMLTNINVIVEEPKNLSDGKGEVKYSATAKLYQGEKFVGVGYALCSSKEVNKKGFDEFAILSMAQTRAIGKAYRNKIGFIMKLAGFQPTPSEEMHKVGETPQELPKEPISDYSNVHVMKKGQTVGPDGLPTWTCDVCGDPIGDRGRELSQKIYKKNLCKEHFDEANKKKK